MPVQVRSFAGLGSRYMTGDDLEEMGIPKDLAATMVRNCIFVRL